MIFHYQNTSKSHCKCFLQRLVVSENCAKFIKKRLLAEPDFVKLLPITEALPDNVSRKVASAGILRDFQNFDEYFCGRLELKLH